jgi:Zn-dependent peptidase ImmA (M78 family)/transcriptional regulator with XRE-family HTH domain
MAVDLTLVGQRLKDARTNRELTQDEVAKHLGLTRAAVIQIENGERPVTLKQLDDLATLYRRPTAEFVAEQPEELLVTLLRATPELRSSALVEQEIVRHVAMCREGSKLERLLEVPSRAGPPAYDAGSPANAAEAAEQGASTARQERQRLGLGENPIFQPADLIAATGIWVSGSDLPDEVSGLFMRGPDFGMFIIVNETHPETRKRFSLAHEYAHALLDRSHSATVSMQGNRTDLVEVRANAFAAAFLLPSGGVRRFLAVRHKGLQSRMDVVVYDQYVQGGDPTRATRRTTPGSQKLGYQEVATLSHRFGVSYQAAVYRLRSLDAITERELRELLEKEEFARDYLRTVKLLDELEGGKETPKTKDRELVKQVADLCIEAFRRNLINKDRLLELGTTIGIGGQTLVALAEATL